MSDSMKITDGSSPISFSPAIGYTKPDDMKILRNRSNNGTLYSYNIFYKRRWEVPLTQLIKASSDQINTWWNSNTTLSFYPDMINTPSTYYSVKITNAERPLLAFTDFQFETLYEGAMTLQQI